MADQGQLAGLLAESNPISNLNSQLPIASPVNMEEFVEQCSGLIEGLDPRSHTDPQKRSISLPKSRLSVTPFQLWEAWKMTNQRERTGGLRGGLQASAAGTAKSFIVVTAALLRARCFESERQTKAFWSNPKKGPKRGPTAASHLPASASGYGLKCPSQKESDIVCYCVPTSKARRFVDAGVGPRGVCLIQAPLPVLGQWISIFEKAVLDTSAYNLCISHSDVPSRLKRDLDRVTKSLSQPAGRGLLEAPETYIFLSAHGNKKMFQTFTSENTPSIGIMFNDESHMAMRLESRSMAIAKAQSEIDQGLDLWLVSATPIRLLEDFELPISIISNSSDLSRSATVADIIASRKTAKSSDENMETFQAHFRRVFDDNLVLRNTVTSQFLGRPITSLQIINPNRVWLTTPQHHFNNVQAVAYQAREVIRARARAAEKNDERFLPEYASGLDSRLHFVSLFPGAANLIRKGDLDIEEESVRNSIDAMKSNKLKVETIARFQQHLVEIVAGSPKLDFIVAEIRRMGQDDDQRPEGSVVQTGLHKENPRIKKMVIVTPTLGTAVFLYLILLKRMPDLVPTLFHTRARPEHREAAMNSFSSLTARKNARHSYILITPFSAGGTGLNLQSANYQILTSPLSTRDAEIQCFARTNRTGQRLALHHSVLITQDNPADQINVVNFGGRSIRNDPFEISRRLVLFEPDGSKAVQRLEDWGYEVSDFVDEDYYEHLIQDSYPIIDEDEFHALRVTVPSVGPKAIDKLIYFDPETTAGDTMAISEAWNKRGDTRPTHEKLPLRDIIVTIWVRHLNRPLRDLRALMYYTVVQHELNDPHRRFVYRLLGEEIDTDLVLNRNSESPQESEAFAFLLKNTPFCLGAQRMLAENPDFAGVQVESFEFLPITDGIPDDDPFFHFRINME